MSMIGSLLADGAVLDVLCALMWAKAMAQAGDETGLEHWPETLPWAMADEVLAADWWPAAA